MQLLPEYIACSSASVLVTTPIGGKTMSTSKSRASMAITCKNVAKYLLKEREVLNR